MLSHLRSAAETTSDGLSLQLSRALALIPLIIAVPAAISLVQGLVNLAGTHVPANGDSSTVDAAALWRGQGLYSDPAHGYISTLYTPLLPLLSAALDHISYWRGWPLLLSYLSMFLLVAVGAWLAYRPRSRSRLDRLLTAVEAVAVGVVVWWLVSGEWLGWFQNGRPDQLAWSLGLAGLVLVPKALRGSWALLALAVVLLSAAFWTKQQALAVGGVAILWTLGALAIGWVGRRAAAAFVGGFLALNLAVLGILNLVTHGWEFFYNFTIPEQGPCCEGGHVTEYVHNVTVEFLAATFMPLLFAAGVWIAFALWGLRQGRDGLRGLHPRTLLRRRVATPSFAIQAATILVLFLVVDSIAAAYARRAIGAATNEALGLAWALGLLGALGYRFARASLTTTAAAAAIVVAVFLLGVTRPAIEIGPYPGSVAALRESIAWTEVNPGAAAYASKHTLYDPNSTPDLSVKIADVYPGWLQAQEVTSIGRTPARLQEAILDRRFDAVALFTEERVAHALTSGAGKYEENYFWKLNEAMRAGYRPAPKIADGVRVRIPGPNPAPWIRRCFGPYPLMGAIFRQHVGGGFWCPSGQSLRLREAPPTVDVSSVRTERPVAALSGLVTVTLPKKKGAFEVYLDRSDSLVWRVQGYVTPSGRLAVTAGTEDTTETRLGGLAPASAGARRAGIEFVQGGGFDARLVGSVLRVTIPPLSGDERLDLAATRGSGALFDLAKIRLRTDGR